MPERCLPAAGASHGLSCSAAPLHMRSPPAAATSALPGSLETCCHCFDNCGQEASQGVSTSAPSGVLGGKGAGRHARISLERQGRKCFPTRGRADGPQPAKMVIPKEPSVPAAFHQGAQDALGLYAGRVSLVLFSSFKKRK